MPPEETETIKQEQKQNSGPMRIPRHTDTLKRTKPVSTGVEKSHSKGIQDIFQRLQTVSSPELGKENPHTGGIRDTKWTIKPPPSSCHNKHEYTGRRKEQERDTKRQPFRRHSSAECAVRQRTVPSALWV